MGRGGTRRPNPDHPVGIDDMAPSARSRAMRSANPATGSPTDILNGLAMAVKGFRDAPDAAYRFPRLARSIESVAERVAGVRRRGGQVHGLEAAASWLRSALEESPALSGPDGGPIRDEMLALLARGWGGG
jgi:hypothetical protein